MCTIGTLCIFVHQKAQPNKQVSGKAFLALSTMVRTDCFNNQKETLSALALFTVHYMLELHGVLKS